MNIALIKQELTAADGLKHNTYMYYTSFYQSATIKYVQIVGLLEIRSRGDWPVGV